MQFGGARFGVKIINAVGAVVLVGVPVPRASVPRRPDLVRELEFRAGLDDAASGRGYPGSGDDRNGDGQDEKVQVSHLNCEFGLFKRIVSVSR